MLDIENCIFFHVTCQRENSEDPNLPLWFTVSLGLPHC